MRLSRHSRIGRVAKDRGSGLLRPAQPLQLPHPDKGMLLKRRVALVIEVVEQGSGRIQLQQPVASLACQPEPVGLGFAIGNYAGFDAQGMLAQALALRPFSEQSPGGSPVMGLMVEGQLFSRTHLGALIISHSSINAHLPWRHSLFLWFVFLRVF